MRVNPENIQRPPSPVPRTYTPPGGRSHPVRLGDSWVSLATSLGIAPWDLIRYNYPGLPSDVKLAAKQVNWYLENYVGCTLVTPDGRNYRFSPPGRVWLPPAPPRPPAPPTPDEVARRRVLAVLRGPVTRRMTFGVGFLLIFPSHYEDIAAAIDAGKIVVKSNAAIGHMAYYDSAAKPARIEISPTTGDGLIIHECTHAIFDMLKLTSRVEQSEGFGYIAQHLYEHLQRGGPPPRRYLVSADPADLVSWFSWQLIFDQASHLASLLSRKRWVHESEAALLYAAVRGANVYRGRVGKTETYDGI